MKGVIVLCLQSLVKEKFGEDKWRKILSEAGMEKAIFLATRDVDDKDVLKIVNALCRVLKISQSQAADVFGDYWVSVCSQKTYRPYYRGAATAKEFLLRTDEIHVAVTRGIPGAKPPRFDYEWKDSRTLIMKYKSHRGLVDFAVGLVKGVGKFYKEDLKVSKLGPDKIQIVFPD